MHQKQNNQNQTLFAFLINKHLRILTLIWYLYHVMLYKTNNYMYLYSSTLRLFLPALWAKFLLLSYFKKKSHIHTHTYMYVQTHTHTFSYGAIALDNEFLSQPALPTTQFVMHRPSRNVKSREKSTVSIITDGWSFRASWHHPYH